MMSLDEEKLEHPKRNGRVKINVGGTYFETTVFTLTRLDNTVLSTMVADRWQNQEELFVDRSPTYFGKILDYLRSGENLVLPADLEARESLRMEAEFYNLPELAKMCLPGLHVNDLVQWKEEAVEAYWVYCGRYDRLKYDDKRKESTCQSCSAEVYYRALVRANYNLTSAPDEELLFVKHEMHFMKGIVTEVMPRTDEHSALCENVADRVKDVLYGKMGQWMVDAFSAVLTPTCNITINFYPAVASSLVIWLHITAYAYYYAEVFYKIKILPLIKVSKTAPQG